MKVLILGGGITGVTIAKKMGEGTILEKEKAGGFLRSYKLNGFTFDTGGHLFHFKKKENRILFERLMGENSLKLRRKSFVYIMGKMVPYPFQANFYPLSQRVKMECLRDFLNVAHGEKKRAKNFREWLLGTFGEAMCRYFFFPYNRKFWGIDLEKITSEWAKWAIPKPSVEEVIRGARGNTVEGLGYNPSFYYPENGGAYSFFKKYSEGVEIIEGVEINIIETDEKKVNTNKGRFQYDVLFSTIPLVEFTKLIREKDDVIKLASALLIANSVTVFNIGFEGKIPECHWIYFPEEKFPFFRLGFYSNFSEKMAPEGFHSLYLEFSGSERKEAELTEALDMLNSEGIIKGKMVLYQKIFIPHAYPIPTREAELIKDGLSSFFKKRQVYIAGRSGSWEYLSTEASMESGTRAVESFKA